MVLAVVDGHLDVLHGVAGNGALGHHTANAFLDGRKILLGHGAAERVINEFEPVHQSLRSFLDRLDAKIHLTKLPRSTGLLLVAVVPFSLAGNGLLVGDLRRPSVHFDSVSILQKLQLRPQVQFANTPDDQFLGRRVPLDRKCGIFQAHFGKRIAQFGLGALGRGFDRKTEHWLGQTDRVHCDPTAVVQMQDIVVPDLVDLGDRHDIAGNRRVDFLVVLAAVVIQVREPDTLATIADLGARRVIERTLMDPEKAQLSNKRIGGDLEAVTNRRTGIVCLHIDAFATIGGDTLKWPGVAFRRVGEQPSDLPHQFSNSNLLASGGEAHWDEMSLPHGKTEWLKKLVWREFARFKVLLHEFLIHFYDLINQLGVKIGNTAEIGFTLGFLETPNDRSTPIAGKVDRAALASEDLLD